MEDIKFTENEALQLLLMINRSETLKANTAIIERMWQGNAPLPPKRNGYQEIASALGMALRAPGQTPVSIDEIKEFIKQTRDRAILNHKEDLINICHKLGLETKGIETTAGLGGNIYNRIKQLDTERGVHKSRIRELENETKQDDISLNFFRDSFQQMKKALFPDQVPACISDSGLVAEVIEQEKLHQEELKSIRRAFGTPEEYCTPDKCTPEAIIQLVKEHLKTEANRNEISAGRFDLLNKLADKYRVVTHEAAIVNAMQCYADLERLMKAGGFVATDLMGPAVSSIQYWKDTTVLAENAVGDKYDSVEAGLSLLKRKADAYDRIQQAMVDYKQPISGESFLGGLYAIATEIKD